jgi:hypothetical protein
MLALRFFKKTIGLQSGIFFRLQAVAKRLYPNAVGTSCSKRLVNVRRRWQMPRRASRRRSGGLPSFAHNWRRLMTDQEIILKARKAFKERDRAARKLQEIDGEIKGLVTQYSTATKVWGFTPLMLRQAVRARLGEIA